MPGKSVAVTIAPADTATEREFAASLPLQTIQPRMNPQILVEVVLPLRDKVAQPWQNPAIVGVKRPGHSVLLEGFPRALSIAVEGVRLFCRPVDTLALPAALHDRFVGIYRRIDSTRPRHRAPA